MLYALCYIAGLLSGAGLAAIIVPPLVSRHWKEVLMHAISEMIPTAVEQYDEGYSQAFNDYREPGEN